MRAGAAACCTGFCSASSSANPPPLAARSKWSTVDQATFERVIKELLRIAAPLADSITALIPLSPLLVDAGQPFLPRIIENFLYFLPQLAFPCGILGVRHEHEYSVLFSPLAAILVTCAHWGTVAVLFAYLTHRFSNLLLLTISALSTIVLITIVGNLSTCLDARYSFKVHKRSQPTRHGGDVLRIAFAAWATGGGLIESPGNTPLFPSLRAATTMPTVGLCTY